MNGGRVRDKLEKLRDITSEQQKRGADKLHNSGNSGDGTIQGVMDTIADTTTPVYFGEYEVTPKTYEETVLPTKDKRLTDNVSVKKIPQYEVSNQSGGETLIIGDEYYGS